MSVGIEQLEALDNFTGVRNVLRVFAEHCGEWAGIPCPIDGEQLIIEPSYPFADAFKKSELSNPDYTAEPEPTTVRACWWSDIKRAEIIIWQEPSGRVEWGIRPGMHHLEHDIASVGCSFAWGIEQEAAAVNLLATLVTHTQFKQYMLTGMFFEQSRRSGVVYMFRRLKPTVALNDVGGRMHVLAALCHHPIAYYAGSWAGAMCPTDDVIAHLMLARGDEHMFWRRANQHHAIRPEAGL